MSTTYLSVDYFPLTVNFFDRDAIELAEAKYGIRVDGAVCKLLCKIFKEGYYIPWGEEQSLIFARKLGGELKGKEIDGIIQILLDKGFFDKESYEKFQILTSLEIHPKLLTFPDKVKERKEKQKRKKTIRLRLRSKSPVMPTTRVRTTSKDFWTAWHNME